MTSKREGPSNTWAYSMGGRFCWAYQFSRILGVVEGLSGKKKLRDIQDRPSSIIILSIYPMHIFK